MRPLLVIVAGERREAALLGGPVRFRRPHRLQQREMEAFVPAVLLRMAGIDPLVPDAELDPPGRQRRQPGRPGRGEGRAVVGADHVGQAIFPKSPLEQRLGFVMRRAGGGRYADQIAAEPVRHRQGFDARAVAEPNPTLVVDAPDMVGVLRHGQFAKPRRTAAPHPSAANQARALEYLAGRRRRRPVGLGLPLRKLVDDLARTPGWAFAPHADDRLRQMLGRRTAVRRGARERSTSPAAPSRR